MNLKEELADIDARIKALEERRAEIYRQSIEAPDEDKVCDDCLASLLGDEPRRFGLTYPIEVSGIAWAADESTRAKPQLVKVRVAGEDQTHLGIYVADLPLGMTAYHGASGVLGLRRAWHNPAIVVPALERIVYGCESWWARIETADDLREITDETIRSQPYFQALESMVTGR